MIEKNKIALITERKVLFASSSEVKMLSERMKLKYAKALAVLKNR